MKHRIHWIIWIGAALLVAACAQPGQNAAAEQTVTVGRGTLRLTVSGSGTVEPAESADVSFRTTGTISDVLVAEGDAVEQDQALAQIDTDLLQVQVDTARAQRDAAQAQRDGALAQRDSAVAQRDAALAQRDSAQAQIDRIEDAEENGNSVTQPVDTSDAGKAQADAQLEQAEAQIRQADAQIVQAESQIKQADAQIAQADAQIRQAELGLDDATVRAPIAGTVIAVNVAPGDNTGASAGISSTGGTSAPFTIADLAGYFVAVNINEADIAQVQEDQTAQITIDALGTEPITGTVRSIASAATVNQNVTSYRVEVELPDDVDGVRIGMTASVEINQDERPDVLVIPSSAVRSEGSQRIVRIREGEQFVDRQIEVGLSNDVETEVVSGLNEGDVIAAIGSVSDE